MPPETRSKPRASSSSASAFAFATICAAYVLNSGVDASFSATAIAAVVWSCGPPCRPGKTALSIASPCASSRQEHRAARPAQRLVRRRRDDRRVSDGGRVRAAGDESGDVRDVGDERARRRPSRSRRSRRSRSCAGSPCRRRTMSFGRCSLREVADLVEVDASGVLADAVLHGVAATSGERGGRAVREVAAHRQRHPHDRVAGLREREVHGEVRRRAGVRLDVHVLDAEQRLRALDRDRLDLVDDLVALVVPLAGVALRVLVREDRAGRLEDGLRDVVLGRDQPDLLRLPLLLGPDELRDLGIDRGQRRQLLVVTVIGASSRACSSDRRGTQAFGKRPFSRRSPVVSSTRSAYASRDAPRA